MIRGKDIQDYVLSDRRMKRRTTIWDMCKQSDSLLLTGGAIVRGDYATLIVGPGTDNLLEATCQFPEQVNGIIGNGRSILFDTKEKILYSMHFPDEVKHYFKEDYTKRSHKPLMNAESNNKIIIMNIEAQYGKCGVGITGMSTEGYKFVEEIELGKNIRINPISKKRKRIRNFASKASHARKNVDVFLNWKEKIPMSFEDIYEIMKRVDMSYYTVVTPFYTGKTAWNYVRLKQGYVNPHEHILEKLLDEKIL